MSTLGFEDVAYAADGLDTVFTEFFAKMMNMNLNIGKMKKITKKIIKIIR